ncbi:hypothetical protein BZY99_07775 [Pectobacterium versatile]|nr:hypothetical protein BZY99_07775 [Pectobacterium versatile]
MFLTVNISLNQFVVELSDIKSPRWSPTFTSKVFSWQNTGIVRFWGLLGNALFHDDAPQSLRM